MRAAFATGALAAGFAAAALAALLVWVATVLLRNDDPWTVAPAIVATTAIVVAVATYLAERLVYRRATERKRSAGEPWAYRQD